MLLSPVQSLIVTVIIKYILTNKTLVISTVVTLGSSGCLVDAVHIFISRGHAGYQLSHLGSRFNSKLNFKINV